MIKKKIQKAINNDFQKKVIITILDIQIYILISFFLYVLVLIDIDFFKIKSLGLISYFIYFMYFDFKLKKTLAMRIYNYKLNVPNNINLMTIFKFEMLRFIDGLLFPFYMILSIFSDKKDRLLLREKYTKIRMEKLAD